MPRATPSVAPAVAPTVALEAEDLPRQLWRLADDIIDEELRRLTRKAPSLSDQDLQHVTRLLHDLVEQLLVGQAQGLPHREPQLRALFSLPATSLPATSLRGST